MRNPIAIAYFTISIGFNVFIDSFDYMWAKNTDWDLHHLTLLQ